MPTIEGIKAVWILTDLSVNQEQVLQIRLQAFVEQKLTNRTSVFVGTSSPQTTTVQRPPNEAPQVAAVQRPNNDAPALAIQLTGPNQATVGKPAVFDIRVTNQSSQPLTGIVLNGLLSEGLSTPAGREILGNVDGSIAPGEFKILKMPTTPPKRAGKPSRSR